MDKKTKEVVDFMLDRIKTQKTMFIPVVAISAVKPQTLPIIITNKTAN